MPMHTAAPPLHRLLGQAADAVAAVRAGRSLTEVLARCPGELRAGTQALAFHALRGLAAAEAARQLLAPKAPPPAVDALLVTALALLWPSADGEAPPYTEHTLVDQAVTAVRQRAPASAGFANAVLRRFVRERATLVPAVQQRPEAAFNHPAWWIDRVQHDWPDDWQALLAAANRRPPMFLRVNARRGTAAAYVARLAGAGLAAAVAGPQAVRLAQPCAVQTLPGFAEGDVSVQDLSAQLAAGLLVGPAAGIDGSGHGHSHGDAEGLPPLPPGARVLDACAAPGGKTAHLLELADLDLLAIDSDAQRLARVQQNLDRLGLTARLAVGDARDTGVGPGHWWDGERFDAILLDAPCTASGIVRRHPDVRWLRRPSDVHNLVRTQAQLLDALWPLLKPGGRLLYATCSIFRDEGERQIDAFLQRTTLSAPRLAKSSPGHLPGVPENRQAPAQVGDGPGPAPSPGAGFSLAPTGDGFFYALITAT